MMKKIFYSLLLGLSLQLNAQIQQLSSFSTGKLEYAYPLENAEKEIIGYAFIYNKGLDHSQTKINHEYVLLDKNLNRLTNGDYEMNFHQKFDYYLNKILFNNGKLNINYSINKGKNKEQYGFLHIVKDLKSGETEIKKHIGYDFVSPELDTKTLSKTGGIYKGKSIHFMRLDVVTNDSDYNILTTSAYLDPGYRYVFSNFTAYGNNYSKVLTTGELMPKNSLMQVFHYGDSKNQKMVIYRNDVKMKMVGSDEVISEGIKLIDVKSGKQISNFKYNQNRQYYSLPSMEFLDDKITVIGEMKTGFKNLSNYARDLPTIGVRRTVIDDKGKFLVDKELLFKDIYKEFGFIGTKRDDDGSKYKLIDTFNFDDLSYTVLFEKSNSNLFKNSNVNDFILSNFDQQGNLINSYLTNTYLFSQLDRENKEILFYYLDTEGNNQKEYNTILINKVKNGELKQEKINVKTNGNTIKIYKAQYGYFIVIEIDRNGNTNGIRLERVNL